MKSIISIVLMSVLSGQAFAQAAPPPLKPVEFLEPEGSAAPATPAEPSVPVAQPAPVVTSQPAPVVTSQPAPVVISQPAPVAISEPAPVVISQPAPIVVIAQPTAINIGDQVATKDYWQGFVAAIHPNETADVRFTDGRIMNFRIATLTKSVYSFGGFTVGQTVTYKKRKTGVIQYVFTNGKADVRFPDKSRIVPLEKLTQAITTLDGFTVGMTVLTESGRPGQIVEIYADGTARARFGDRTKLVRLSRRPF